MSYDKQWFIDTLRHSGYEVAADAAQRELPDPVTREEATKFAERFGISRDELVSQMGGSP